VAELERTVIAMKRVVEKLQQENKRLISGRKDTVIERKVSAVTSLLQRLVIDIPQ
jgi:hypothetical protein